MVIQVVQHFGVDPNMVFMLAVAIWLVLSQLSVVDTDEIELLLAEAVRDSLRMARITEDDAAGKMRMDVSLLRRQLRGEPNNHISLTRLIRLSYEFWLWFGPVLMFLVSKRRFDQIGDELSQEMETIRARALMGVLPKREAAVDGRALRTRG